MKTGKAARRYGKALFKLARDEDRLEAVHGDLEVLRGWLAESAPFAGFVENPLVPPEKRAALLDRLLGEGAEPITGRFLRFLDAKGRLAELGGICAAFEELYHQQHNILKVDIISAMPLSEEQAARIRARFGERFGKAVQSTVSADPSLLGGFKVRVKDTIYDSSIQAQLAALRRRLLNA